MIPRITMLAAVLALMMSCAREPVIVPVINAGHAFDKNGACNVETQANVKTVYQYFTLRELKDVLGHTPQGKIDRIVRENPDWQFVFYCNCPPSDSGKLVGLLARYKCDFPVILDSDASFLRINSLGSFSALGYICDEKGRILGTSVIGTSQSFFDSEFAKAKSP